MREKFHDGRAAKSEQYEVRGQSPFDAFIFDFRVLQIDTFSGIRNADSGIVPQEGSLQRPQPAALSGSLTKAPGSAGGYLLQDTGGPLVPSTCWPYGASVPSGRARIHRGARERDCRLAA